MKTFRTATIVIALLIAIAAHPYAPVIALVALSVWSLVGTVQAIQALSLLPLVKFLNPAIYHFEGPVALCGWIALLIAGLRIFYDNPKNKKAHPVIPWLLLFSLVVLLESFFSSRDTLVSILKIVAFTFGATAVLIGFKVTASRPVDWTPWFLGVWIAVVTLSAPTFFFPQIGFARNGTGFQGILSHPQSLGIFLAPMVAWLTATLLLSTANQLYWMYILTPVAWGFLFLTAARTGLVAVGASFLVLLFVAFTRRQEWVKPIMRGALRPVSVVIGLGVLALLLLYPSVLVEKIYGFVHKGQTGLSVEQSFEQSRGRGIESQWENFKGHPIFGIGFGVSLDESFKPTPDPIIGLPLSAPVEKGFLPTAILEETGFLGTLCFLFFLLNLIKQVFAKADIATCWVLLASLFANVGEMIFFAVNGPGLYMWVLVGWTTCAYWRKSSAS